MTKELEDYSDNEIIAELFRRRASGKSTVLAVKVWTYEDFEMYADDISPEEYPEVADFVNIDILEDCTDDEWSAIIDGLHEYMRRKNNG